MRKSTCNIQHRHRTIRGIFIFSVGLVIFLFVVEMTHIKEYHAVKTINKHIKNNIQRVLGPVLPLETEAQPLMDNTFMYRQLSKELVNLPGDFWYKQVVLQNTILEFNKTCARIPNLIDLKFENINWQVLDIPSEGHLQLHAAYLDNRPNNPLAAIRILGMVTQEKVIDTKLVFPELHCQIWSTDSNKPILTKVFTVDYVWREYWGKPQKGSYHPYLMTCVLPEDYRGTPKAVSLVRKPCDTATNLLKVTYDNSEGPENPEDIKVCVCTTAISEMENKSLQLVEWLEWLIIIGVKHVDIKVLHVHREMQKVLDYYSQQNFLTYTKMYLYGNGPNTPYLQYLFQNSPKYNVQFDLLVYNDCLLKNMYKYDFVIPLDLNEIIMTKEDSQDTPVTIQEVLVDAPKDKDFYALERMTFIEELSDTKYSSTIPTFFTFLKSVYRLKPTKDSPNRVRTLFNTKTMLMIHNHYPLESVKGQLSGYDIEERRAVVEMHLKNCINQESCTDRKQFDTAKWRFKDDVIGNAALVIKYLGFA